MNIKMIVSVYLIVNTVSWLLRHVMITRAAKKTFLLDSKYPLGRQGPLPKLTMLVAARNESNNIGRCLESLLAQDYPDLEIIAIDDRSDDDTGEIISRLAATSNGRLRGLSVETLPESWLGKSHAMHLGVARANGEYLCFTDADCFFMCPSAISISMEYAIAHEVDLLSVLPVLETSTFWERVLQPVCSAILMLWFMPEKVNDPASSRAYANGAFMLFRKESYEAIGGHVAVASKMNEDMEFARLTKSAGHKLHVVQNRDLYRARMYENFRSTINGWTRIFYGCFAKPSRAIAAFWVLLLSSVLPYLVLAGGLILAGVRGWAISERGVKVIAWSAVAVVSQMSIIARFYRLMGLRWYRFLMYPLGAVVSLGILLNAACKFFGAKIVWRDRQIKTDRTTV